MHNPHLSVLDYKKQERVKEVAALEEKLEGAQVVLELKEERIESLEKKLRISVSVFEKNNPKLKRCWMIPRLKLRNCSQRKRIYV